MLLDLGETRAWKCFLAGTLCSFTHCPTLTLSVSDHLSALWMLKCSCVSGAVSNLACASPRLCEAKCLSALYCQKAISHSSPVLQDTFKKCLLLCAEYVGNQVPGDGAPAPPQFVAQAPENDNQGGHELHSVYLCILWCPHGHLYNARECCRLFCACCPWASSITTPLLPARVTRTIWESPGSQ